MRTVIGGTGADTTAATLSYITSNVGIWLKTLYLIGASDDPQAFFMTDYEAPLTWSQYGTFLAANIKRGSVSSKIGLEVTSLDVTWAPKNAAFTASRATANPYQLAMQGFFDNKQFRAWTVFMPTPGDANTLGAAELFGGLVANLDIAPGRGTIKFTISSFLNAVDQLVPPNVIELNNTIAGFTGATPPRGFTTIPQFNVIAGSTQTNLILDCTNVGPHHVFGANTFQLGYVYFNNPAGSTLNGYWSPIGANSSITILGTPYNQVILLQPLPWAPTPGTDTCYISSAAPINQADGDYEGFPYVPAPEDAV